MWDIIGPHRLECLLEVGGRRFPYGTSSYCHFSVRPKESLGDRSVGRTGLLGRHDFRQRDLGCSRLLRRWDPTI
jgi:hypothetical protein